MKMEKQIADYIVKQKYEDLSAEDVEIVKKQFLAYYGGVISGWNSGGCEAVAQLAPARVVYISCNPETQVRDVRWLEMRGYRLTVVQPVDMFPHTDHIEAVAVLQRA